MPLADHGWHALHVLALQIPNEHSKAVVGLALYSSILTMLLQRTLLALESGSGRHRDDDHKSRVSLQRELPIIVFMILFLGGCLVFGGEATHP